MKISSTKVKCYKSCKRLYYLKYVEGLEYTQPIDVLEQGKSYHSIIEDLNKTGFLIFNDNVDLKIRAMAEAYRHYIYPQFKCKAVEEWFEFPLGEEHTLVGRFDAIAEDGCVVEHKTTSADVDDEYIYNLQWDEQILNYMLASGKNEMWYTVCKKPTIRQKQNETEEEFLARCIAWYDDDTENKIRVIKVTRSENEVEHQRELLIRIAQRMEYDEAWNEATIEAKGSAFADEWFYRNPSHCTCYGRRCEFAPICLDYDPKPEYVEFRRKENENQ